MREKEKELEEGREGEEREGEKEKGKASWTLYNTPGTDPEA